jgi:3-hydroxyacyl-CoA dehydrogenase
MPELVHRQVRERIAILTIDNPPVNALGPGVWEAIDAAVAQAAADPEVVAIVLMGSGQTFVAGADIRVFDAFRTREDSLQRSVRNHGVLRRMEDVRKPLVAAIHGHALGGGLEVAMGCHYRVARRDAIVGQPEVLLGIIPGAGGTQRLPRLCGVAAAIDLCTTGRMVTALEAHEMGLVDALTDGDVVKAALAFAADRARVGATRKAREIELSAEAVREGIAACDTAEARLRAAPVPAAWRAVTAIRAGLAEGFDAGSSLERELFADCALSLESKALRQEHRNSRDSPRSVM